jgi:hypothetical protein
MADSYKNEKRINDPSPERYRAELEAFFQHVLEHDPKDLQFSVMLAGHKENEGIHMCTMVGGPPPMIARALMELQDTLVKEDPGFAIAFLLCALNNMRHAGASVIPIGGKGVDLSKFDQTGGADISQIVGDFLSSLQNGGNDDDGSSTPPKGNIH